MLDKTLSILTPDISQFSTSPASGIRVMWIGHSTVVVQFDGMTIMTDPVFSKRGSPVSFWGPKRYREPPCSIEELPKLDAIVISHSHYDHLDIAAVKRLNARFGASLRWYVPIGLQWWMKSVGCENVKELSWWEENSYNGFRFASVPCQHWSKRSLFDTNKVSTRDGMKSIHVFCRVYRISVVKWSVIFHKFLDIMSIALYRLLC